MTIKTLGFVGYSAEVIEVSVQKLILGDDGNIYAASSDGLLKCTPAGVVTLHNLSNHANEVCQGSDGYLYITIGYGGRVTIAKYDVTTMTEVSDFYLGYDGFGPLITRSDGNVWGLGNSEFPSYNTQFAKFDISAGTLTTYPVALGGGSQPYDDGTYMWTAGTAYNSGASGPLYLQRTDLSGTTTSYEITSVVNGATGFISDGAGAFWVATNDGLIRHVDTSGSILETLTCPTSTCAQRGILGPDGNPWFADIASNQALLQVDVANSVINQFAFVPNPDTGSGWSPGGVTAASQGGQYPTDGVIGSDGNMWWNDANSYSSGNVAKCVSLDPNIVMVQ